MRINALRPVRAILAAVLVAAGAATALAADLTGTWTVDGAVYGNPVKYAAAFKQEGDTLTGTVTMDGKEYPLTGTVAEKAVTWKFQIQYNGSPLDLEFSGTKDSDTAITGTIAVMGVQGQFTATRAATGAAKGQ